MAKEKKQEPQRKLPTFDESRDLNDGSPFSLEDIDSEDVRDSHHQRCGGGMRILRKQITH